MPQINYAYVDPGGNPTVLVLDRVPRKDQPALAKKILASKKLVCEQVGFLRPAKRKQVCNYRLQMMGGEFCGNALRAAAAYLADNRRKRTQRFYFESSGTKDLIITRVRVKGNKQVVWSETEVPVPKQSNYIKFTQISLRGKTVKVAKVELEGITHFLVPRQYFKQDDNFKRLFTALYEKGSVGSGACGIIFFQKIRPGLFSATPVIYVRKTNSVVLETSCASGAVALALGKGEEKENRTISVRQPSGYILKVRVSRTRKGVSRILIGGEVIEVKQGVMKVQSGFLGG